MFASLGLPVCDDDRTIKAKRDEQRAARNRELNSTKGSVAAKAQKWFDDVDALLNRREALLGVVYEEWASLCEVTLRACLDAGQDTLGADTQLALRDLACSWCRARPDLANRWLSIFLEQRGLAVGGIISKPRIVSNLACKRGRRKVALRWTRPDDACDSLRIVRSADPPGDGADDEVVFEGNADRFTDTGVEPGEHYIYRVYSIYDERESLTSAVARTKMDAVKTGSGRLQALVAALLLAGLAAVAWLHGPELLERFWPAESSAEALSEATLDAAAFTPGSAAPDADAAVQDELAQRRALAHTAADEAAGVRTGRTTPQVTRSSTGASAEPLDPDAEQPDGSEAAPDEPSEPEELPAPPTASLREPPSLAFADRTLRLELGLTGRVKPALVEAALQGLAFKRVELDVTPPAVIFDVLPLPAGVDSARARWSFRLEDAHGQRSEPVVGSCVVLPAD